MVGYAAMPPEFVPSSPFVAETSKISQPESAPRRGAFSFPNGLIDLRQLVGCYGGSSHSGAHGFDICGDCRLDTISRFSRQKTSNKTKKYSNCIKHHPCIIQLYFKSSCLFAWDSNRSPASLWSSKAPPAEVSHGQLHQTSHRFGVWYWYLFVAMSLGYQTKIQKMDQQKQKYPNIIIFFISFA